MARSHKIHTKRKIEGDPIYGSRMLSRFINKVMVSGKKSIAQREVYKALELLKEKGHSEPLKVFEQAITTVGPKMEVKPRRIGGASYQVPSEVRGERRISLAVRWMIMATQKRSNKEFHSFAEKLAAELIDILNNQGEAIKKRDAVQRVADANRAFAHFRW